MGRSFQHAQANAKYLSVALSLNNFVILLFLIDQTTSDGALCALEYQVTFSSLKQ